MAMLDEQYTKKAQEIEEDALNLCKLRQMDTSISKEAFHQEYKQDIEYQKHRLKKYDLDIRAKVYDYLKTHPKWRNRLDNVKFMDVFDECLRNYQPQGKYFLSMFLNRYELRMRDTKKTSYIDEKDSVFKNADSIDVTVNDDEDGTNKISPLDKNTVKNYKDEEIAMNHILNIYQEAHKRLGEDYLPYLRYFFTLTALTITFPIEDARKSEYIYLDKDLFLSQTALTKQYMQEYKQQSATSSKLIQENAFLRAKYIAAIAESVGLKQDTMRKKLKQVQNVITEIGAQLHFVK